MVASGKLSLSERGKEAVQAFKPAAEKPAEKGAADVEEEGEEVDDSNLDPKDIELVMSQVCQTFSRSFFPNKSSNKWNTNRNIFFPFTGNSVEGKGCQSFAKQFWRYCERYYGADHVKQTNNLTALSFLPFSAW